MHWILWIGMIILALAGIGGLFYYIRRASIMNSFNKSRAESNYYLPIYRAMSSEIRNHREADISKKCELAESILLSFVKPSGLYMPFDKYISLIMNTVSIPVESDAYKALSEIIRIKQKVGSAPATIGGKRISNEALIEIIKDKYRLDVADDSLVRKIYFSACDHSNTNKHMFFG